MPPPVFNPPTVPTYQSEDAQTFQTDVVQFHAGYDQVRALNVRGLRRGRLLWNVKDEETRDYIQDFIDSLEGLRGPFLWTSFDKQAPPVTRSPILEAVAGGALGARTYYVDFTWYDSVQGETTKSLESSIAVPANQFLKVTVPRVPTGVEGFRVYASETSGSTEFQATVTTGRTWTQSAALSTGTGGPPSTNTLTPQRRFHFASDPPSPREGFDHWSGALDVIEELV